ncbi:MAG: hypothetical protein GXP55_09970, partial [Deltaproteobacteria bacterium]|nr:hypothetical protein [Deltaproteobacteria bacterium]
MNNDNMARLSEDEMEMAVAAYLAPLVEGERVFWALAARGGLGYLKRTAREVLTRAPENEPVGWWIGRWPASPSADAVDALLARSGSSQRVALLLSDPEGLPGLREACAARFSQLRVLGLGALRAVGLAELGVAPAGVAFDDSLAALRSPEALLLIAGDDLSTLERYVVVALPARPGSEGERAAPGPEASLDSIHEREVSRLEQKLRQLARRRREAEAELERRGALLRDWALRVSTSVVEGSPHAYASRAAAAEAQREEARFAADELRLALRAARADARAAALTQAAFDGRVR